MKKIDIPKEKNEAVNGQSKVMYAPDENGEFKRFQYGSKVEEYATKIAVNEYETLKKEALEKIKRKETSAIEYFMYKNRMDLPTLASITGIFQFRIKKHLKVKGFENLNDKTLEKYARAFNIEINDLKEFSCE